MRLDGNPVDMATTVVAVVCIFIRPLRRLCRGDPAHMTLTQTVQDFLTGTVIVPFVLLFAAVFSSDLFVAIATANRCIFAVGAFVGLVFVAREFLAEPAAAVLPPEGG